jgi:hypothetical protein
MGFSHHARTLVTAGHPFPAAPDGTGDSNSSSRAEARRSADDLDPEYMRKDLAV